MLEVEFAECSDAGRARDHNEDYLGSFIPGTPAEARDLGWLFALADGVGGQDRGEVASRETIETVVAGFRSASPGESHTTVLTRLAQAANTRVYQEGHRAVTPGSRSMASTLVCCALRYDRVTIAHVGDSRCYLVRQGHATQLTRDHTVVNEQLRLGLLSPGEAAGAATGHLLTRSIGNDLFVAVETADHQIYAGDFLLLCSDGLHASVGGADMAGILGRGAPLEKSAQDLVALANHRDGSDNVSLVLIRVANVERMGMYRGRPYKLR